MSYGEFNNEDGKDKALAADTVLVSHQAQLREAFREWLDASKAWSTLSRNIAADENSSSARRELRKLERRLNAAADAFHQAQQRLSENVGKGLPTCERRTGQRP